jgi:hypothetical protein
MPRTNKILIRSGTTTPSASDFAVGEPAFDKSAGKLYIKNAAGTMVELGTGGGGGGGSVDVYAYATPASFPATGSSAVIYIATDTSRAYQWAGTAYMELGPIGGNVDTVLRSLLVPPAPTNLIVATGDAQATLSWTAPTVLAQTPITDYTEQYSIDNGANWTTFTQAASTATSATVTGLTNGTAYKFRVAAVNAVGVGAYTSASSAVTPVAGDPLFSSVQLLLRGDTSIADASAYSRSVTAAGGATFSAAQSKWGGGSLLFDSASKYLSVPSSGFTMTGDFVMECWVYITGSDASLIVDARSDYNAYQDFAWYLSSSGYMGLVVANSGARLDGTSAPVSRNQWTHIALVRSAGVVSAYVNGVRDAVIVNYNNTITPAASTLRIGSNGSNGFSGYIDDFRVTIGNNRGYTGATIIVPAAAFFTRGLYEDPFFSNVSLLLSMDGTGSTFTDRSLTPKTITVGGNATQSEGQSKFGGKSALFNGTNDSLTVPNSDALNLAGVDWAIEAWLHPTSSPQYVCVVGKRSFSEPTSYYIYMSNGVMGFYTGTLFNSETTIPTNQWTHIAWSMASGTLRAYVGGAKVGEWSSVTIEEVDVPITIGRHFSSLLERFVGYIDDLRITKGSHRGYTGATITVPTAAFPNS